MGDKAAILGVILLLAGVVMVALLGNRRSSSWASYTGVGLAVLGMGIEVIGAVHAAA